MRLAGVRLGARYAANRVALVARQAGLPAAAAVGTRFVAGEAARLPRAARRVLLRPGGAWSDRHPPMSALAIAESLTPLGVEIHSYYVNLPAFRAHIAAGRYPRHYAAGPLDEGGMREQKLLEYFVSLDLLALQPGEVLVDVASEWSLFPPVARRLTGATVYRQDLIYPPGVHGDRIGGSAARLPVPADFAHALVLHNAFEHFEGAADSAFIREAARVLAPGGRLCILPLLLSDRFYNVTDPLMRRHGLVWDPGAEVRELPWWRNRFGRFYDAAALERRVLAPARAAGLRARLYRIANVKEVHPRAYLHFALLLRKPDGEARP